MLDRASRRAGLDLRFSRTDEGQPEAIARAERVANPGCYATGAIALLRPLVDAGLIPSDHRLTINAVSGYSGGGKKNDRGITRAGARRYSKFTGSASSTSTCRKL